MSGDILAAFDALPRGAFTGRSQGRRYRVTRTEFAGGRSAKLVAHELDGPDYISFNLYRLTAGARLRPCEMSAEKVEAFILDLRPD